MKRKIKHSHVEVVEKQQRKIEKSVIVMHVQSFCFASQNFFWPSRYRRRMFPTK